MKLFNLPFVLKKFIVSFEMPIHGVTIPTMFKISCLHVDAKKFESKLKQSNNKMH